MDRELTRLILTNQIEIMKALGDLAAKSNSAPTVDRLRAAIEDTSSHVAAARRHPEGKTPE